MKIPWFAMAAQATTAIPLVILGSTCSAQYAPASSAVAVSSTAPSAQEPAPAAVETSPSATTVNVSQVRIVRLSQVQGQVRLDRKTDQKFEEAFVNLPIVAGVRLQTLQGLAEVEFEDNSSLRLTPNSLVEFPVLGRDASGATATTVKLLSGSLYLSMSDNKAPGGFTILAGNKTITLAPASHFRLDMTSPTAKLVVFKGEVTVADASGSAITAPKKWSVTFDPNSSDAPVMARNESGGSAEYDKWDKTEAEYHQVRAAAMGFANSPYAYGTNDLSYYGTFASFDGCGTMWRPYLASAAWSPYGSGVWSWYPGAGYSWVSPYPWAWTPYHSGNWMLCPSSGMWGWQPSGGWSGLNNLQTLRSTKGRPSQPAPPGRGEPTLVGVNIKALAVSSVGKENAFVFVRDSAGLGVPRGVFNNLGKVSQAAVERGAVTSMVSEGQAQRGMIPYSRPAASTSQAESAGRAASYSSAASSSMSTASSSSSSMSSGASHASSSGGGGHH
jgi:hypothetical protein